MNSIIIQVLMQTLCLSKTKNSTNIDKYFPSTHHNYSSYFMNKVYICSTAERRGYS